MIQGVKKLNRFFLWNLRLFRYEKLMMSMSAIFSDLFCDWLLWRAFIPDKGVGQGEQRKKLLSTGGPTDITACIETQCSGFIIAQ